MGLTLEAMHTLAAVEWLYIVAYNTRSGELLGSTVAIGEEVNARHALHGDDRLAIARQAAASYVSRVDTTTLEEFQDVEGLTASAAHTKRT